MNKVRRGDMPAEIPVSGMPANLGFGTKLATPLKDDGLKKMLQENEPRREPPVFKAQPRRDLTSADALRTPETDE